MYNSDENKTNSNRRMRNAIYNGTLAAPIYEKNPNHLYTLVHIVNNPMSVTSSLFEFLENDHNVVSLLENFLPNCNASSRGSAPSTSRTILKNCINGNTRDTSNNRNAANNFEKAPLPPPEKFV